MRERIRNFKDLRTQKTARAPLLGMSPLTNNLRVFFNTYALRYHVTMAFLYGSWPAGLERSDSDVDVAVVFEKTAANNNEAFFLVTELSYRLSEQLKKEVNVIAIDNDFLHPMLYYNALILGEPVFIGDSNRYAQLMLEAVYQMEDFQIFGIPWQREAARKNMEGFNHD